MRQAGALALLALAAPTEALFGVDKVFGTAHCVLTKCMSPFFASDACWECLDEHVRFGNQLPVVYTKDMLAFKTTDRGYTEGWCGNDDVPTGGWRRAPQCVDQPGWYDIDGQDFTCDYYVRHGICKKEGDKWANFGATANQACCGCGGGARREFVGCEASLNFPGRDTTSIQSWHQVVAEMKTMVGRFAREEIWRGNELGFIISNELYWQDEVTPKSVGLGATPKQHAVVRPYLDAWFTCDATCASDLKTSAKNFMGGLRKMEVQADVKKWVHTELFKRVFPGAQNPIDLDEFVANQNAVVSFSTVTQLLPDWLSNVVPPVRESIDILRKHYLAVRVLVEQYYGAELAQLGPDACAPSKSCVDQVAAGALDALYFAGGLSVPSAISTGMWVLYADTSAHGATFPAKYHLNKHDPLPFFYESMRFFAPVVGFPWWEQAPARKFDEAASQYDGGVRRVLNVALANKDPNVWGADAHQFRVRSEETYHTYFVGFADHAVDAAYPTQTRKCPGKTLAVAMGAAWFGELDQRAWGSADGRKVASKYEEKVPFVEEFTLEKRAWRQ